MTVLTVTINGGEANLKMDQDIIGLASVCMTEVLSEMEYETRALHG